MKSQNDQSHTVGKGYTATRWKSSGGKFRYRKLDGLRGLTLISMILYHAMWDMIFIFGQSHPWYTQIQGYIWQQSICWCFILLSGFVWSLGKHHFSRGAAVFIAGLIVTIVTVVFMPDDVVYFGVLTLIGSCMILMTVLDPLFRHLPALESMIASFLLFIVTRHAQYGYIGFTGLKIAPQAGPITRTLPASLYKNWFTTWVGFPVKDFYSTDYFPLLPWFFLFLTGYFLYHMIHKKHNRLLNSLTRGWLPPLEWLGRHSLGIYLLHQPVIYLVLTLWFKYKHLMPV